MKEIIIGIDLGTTNSEVAVIENGQPIVISDSSNNKMLPSFVGVAQDGSILVGESARNQYAVFPERTIKSIKRRMGTDEKVEMAGATYMPQEISAMILKRLREVAESHVGQAVNKAVITVPAYFNNAQRQATRESGEIAGLDVVRMINEPTAAALSYECGHQDHKKILVYDLGGGTFDVSVVEIQHGVVEVLSSHGNNRLGGDDFDQKIVKFLIEQIKVQHDVDVGRAGNPGQTNARILRAAIEAKIKLSDHPFVMIEEEYLTIKDGIPVSLSVELSRESYEQMIMPFIDDTLDAVHIALTDAALTTSDIDEILLVGGSTRTPLVANMLAAEVGIEPRSEVDPDLCVATGAAIQAGMIAGEKVSLVLVDVTPYTFGTHVLDEFEGMPYPYVYAPIIKKNTPIPVKKSEVFFTLYDEQERVDVKIYQGEELDAQKNSLIGEFSIEGLSKSPANSPIVMELELDLNGVLQVTAVEKLSGLKRSISIKDAVSRMNQEDLDVSRGRIDALFKDEGNTIDSGSNMTATVVEARECITKAEKMLGMVSADDKDDMLELIEAINVSIELKDRRKLKKAIEDLSDILYYLEL